MNASWSCQKSTETCRICQGTTLIRADSGTGSTGWANGSMRRGPTGRVSLSGAASGCSSPTARYPHVSRAAGIITDVSTAELRRAGVVAVLRAPSAAIAIEAVDALVAGGIRGIEITFSTPDAAQAIREIGRRHGDRV